MINSSFYFFGDQATSIIGRFRITFTYVHPSYGDRGLSGDVESLLDIHLVVDAQMNWREVPHPHYGCAPIVIRVLGDVDSQVVTQNAFELAVMKPDDLSRAKDGYFCVVLCWYKHEEFANMNYSKWDAIEDSDEENEKRRSQIMRIKV